MIEEIKCTAWDCIGKYSELIDTSHLIKLKRSLYASANYRGGNTIRLDHIAWDKDDKLKIIKRYVHPDTPVLLVPIIKKKSTIDERYT